MKRFLIFGAGAVGSYLGGYLAQAGHDVTLITRSGAAHIEQHGLTIVQAGGGRFTVRPAAVTSLRQGLVLAEEAGESIDYLVLAMKAYDLPRAIDELVAFAPQPPTLVTLQNGIDVENLIVEQFGGDNLIAGTLTTPVSYDARLQLVEGRGDRGLAFADYGGGRLHEPLVELIQEAGLKTIPVKNARSLKWSKALVNMIGNATSAIVNRPPGILYEFRPLYELEMRMLRETLAVMKALQIPVVNLPGTPVRRLEFALKRLPGGLLYPIMKRLVSSGRGDKMPSFQIDLAAGKNQSEVLYHNGAVHRIGRELGIPTPVNGALTDILLQIANAEVDWERYNGKPKQLLAAANEYIRSQRSDQA